MRSSRSRPLHAWSAILFFALAAPWHDAHARRICVSTADELRAALAQVSDGGDYVDEENVITLQPGVYLTGGTPFRSEALTTTASLEISGGWIHNCLNVAPGAPSSVLDAEGVGGVVVIKRPHGAVVVNRLVVQNGNADVGAGVQINYGTASASFVQMYRLIVRNNHATGDGGGLYIFGGSPLDYSPIQLFSMLIADNSSGSDGGGAYLDMTNGGLPRFSSLTIASNTALGDTGGMWGRGGQAYNTMHSVIAWGNVPTSLGFDLPLVLESSDVDTFTPGTVVQATDVIAVDPVFADPASGDYHLDTGTPLLRSGSRTLFYLADVDGYLFPPSSGLYRAEMGAYQAMIFVDGFDGVAAP
jgi:hypothetical protein